MFRLPEQLFIVAPPKQALQPILRTPRKESPYMFLFASTPDCHKNFELVCQASEILEKKLGEKMFEVILTITGTENRYAKWLFKQWSHVKSLKFAGFMTREKLYHCYAETDCLIFPSRIETWGLPISEFAPSGKPMLLADLPYAHETAAGSKRTAFFTPDIPEDLARKMDLLLSGDETFLREVKVVKPVAPIASSWEELFNLLLVP